MKKRSQNIVTRPISHGAMGATGMVRGGTGGIKVVIGGVTTNKERMARHRHRAMVSGRAT